METQLNIFEFTDYRSYLNSYYQDTKKKNYAWSYEAWAQKMGLKSNSSILKILNGQREAGPEVTHKFIDYFKFKNDERIYFEDLVRLSKAKKDPRLAVALMQKIQKTHPKSKTKFLNDKEFSAISHWWFYAIRQMVRLIGFKNDPKWISRKLAFHVPSKEINKAINILVKLKLLKLDQKTKQLSTTKERLNTSDDVASEALKRFHEEMLMNAKTAIRSIAVKDRQISGCTLAVSKEDIPKAKKLVREFEEEFSKLFDSKNADTVYQLNVQFFPLIKNLIPNKKGVIK